MENQQKRSIWPYLVIVACITGMCVYWLTHKENNPQYITNTVTDTIYKSVYLTDTGKGRETQYMAPKTVTIYKTLPGKPYPVKDTIWYPDSTGKKIVYLKPDYLGRYPFHPHLVAARFTGNGIEMDLWDTSATMMGKTFKTDYQNFDYFWDGFDMEASPKKTSTIKGIGAWKKNLYTNSNLYLYQEVFTQTTFVAVDYSAMIKRVGIYGAAGIGYNNTHSDIRVNGNIGIRIKLR